MLDFSRIYVEERIRAHPRTRAILERFPAASVIPIDHHQDVFNRGRQHFQLQKQRPALILAQETERFLYESDERIESFGPQRVFYNAMVRNCVYNCDYCFLQGMHPSGHILLFVNVEDFLSAAVDALAGGPKYVSISYLTDILAFEDLVPFVRLWVNAARHHPDLTVEIRTKSDNFRAIADLEPPENVILVWSLTPERYSRAIEGGTASFKNRLFQARRAAQAGWRLRLCFDPVLLEEGWREEYPQAVEETFRAVPAERVEAVSVGVFRMNADFLKRMQRLRPDAPVLHYPYTVSDGLASYEAALRRDAEQVLRSALARHLADGRISFVHG
jgi:spore photoproduct lyase